ncbi:hypothetical protein VTK73DRAFT_7906 [Phialemonium thermophilum]|uniref:Uncharacterized protein n=1 Tax=Phialemonium thermophilum TaxID=223376 RepID=A0ABR3WC14_9PEZI
MQSTDVGAGHAVVARVRPAVWRAQRLWIAPQAVVAHDVAREPGLVEGKLLKDIGPQRIGHRDGAVGPVDGYVVPAYHVWEALVGSPIPIGSAPGIGCGSIDVGQLATVLGCYAVDVSCQNLLGKALSSVAVAQEESQDPPYLVQGNQRPMPDGKENFVVGAVSRPRCPVDLLDPVPGNKRSPVDA